MSGTVLLRKLVSERLAAATEEIFGLVEKTIAEYQDEAVRSKLEICQLHKQIEQLTVLIPEVKLFKADTQLVSEDLLPSLQQCDIKVEEFNVTEETAIREHPQIKEEQEDQCISPDMETDASKATEFRLFISEPTNCELSPSATASTVSLTEDDKGSDCEVSWSPPQSHLVEQEHLPQKKKSNYFFGMDFECVQEIQRALPELKFSRLMAVVEFLASEVGVTKRENLAYVEEEDLQGHLTVEQCCKAIQTFKQKVLKDRHSVNYGVHDEQTLSSMDTSCTRLHCPVPSSIKRLNSWISSLEIPWDKLPASLSQAITRGTKAYPADTRAMVRAVVEAMQEHCPNPNKAACIEVAKMIVSKYPGTFADTTKEGELFGKSFFSLVNKLKRRVEHVNRYSKHKKKGTEYGNQGQ